MIKLFRRTSFKTLFLLGLIWPIGLVFVLSMFFDNDPVADPNAFLDNLSQLLGAAVGIIFTISTIAVTIASDKYTSQIFSRYLSDWKPWVSLTCILIVITIATISIGLNDPMTEFYYWLMVLFFIWSIEALLYYVLHTMDSLQPETLAQYTLNQGLQALDKHSQLPAHEQKDKESPLIETAAILAGLTIKAIEQRDEALAEKYLTAMGALQEKWATVTLEPFETNLSGWDIFSKQYESPIINEYERIFKLVYAQISENLKVVFLSLLRNSIDQLIVSDNNIRKLGTVLRQYNSIFKFMMIQGGKEENVRFPFFMILRNTIEHYQNHYIATCTNAISGLLQIIIELDDHELWDKGLDFFTTNSLSSETLRDYLTNDLTQLVSYIPNDQYHGYWHYLRNLILYGLEPKWTFDNFKVFKIGLEQIMNAIPNAIRSNAYYTQNVYRHMRSLEINTHLADSLYVMCLNLFAQGEYSYIVKLWQFRGPNHNNIQWLPRRLDFLTIQMMEHQIVAFGIINRKHLAFSEETYVYQYYLLCLAYLLQKGSQEFIIYPELPSKIIRHELGKDTILKNCLVNALQTKYIQLQNLPHILNQKILRQYDNVARLAEDKCLEQAFDNNFLVALEKARQWLESPQINEKIERSSYEIAQVFPLVESKINNYRQSFEGSYQNLEDRFGLLTIEAHRPISTKTLFSHTEHLHKNIFTDLKAQNGFNDSELHINGLVSSLYEREYSYILAEIRNHRTIHSITSDELAWDMIIDAANNLSRQFYSDYFILWLPLDQVFFFERTVSVFGNVADQIGRRIVEIQRENHEHPVRFLVLPLHNSILNAILFSPVSIQWTTIEFPSIVLSDCPRDEKMMHISANGVFACEIVMPNGIVWFEFTTISHSDGII